MTIASITKNLDKMVKKLREHATYNITQANNHDELSRSHEASANEARVEAMKAHKIADNIQNIITAE